MTEGFGLGTILGTIFAFATNCEVCSFSVLPIGSAIKEGVTKLGPLETITVGSLKTIGVGLLRAPDIVGSIDVHKVTDIFGTTEVLGATDVVETTVFDTTEVLEVTEYVPLKTTEDSPAACNDV